MKSRKDSPFAKLSDEQCDHLLLASQSMSVLDLVEMMKQKKPDPIDCSITAMRKFLRRLAKENVVTQGEEAADVVEALAKRAASPMVRDATLETLRQKMFESAVETNNREAMMEMFEALSVEREKDRAALLEERKVKAAEENAKIGWRKLEWEMARSGLRALPRIREALMDGSRSAEERLAEVSQILGQADAGPLQLAEGRRPEVELQFSVAKAERVERVAIPVERSA